MASTAHHQTPSPATAHIYSGEYSKTWPVVQQLYKKDPSITKPADVKNAQELYRNSICTLLHQIYTRPDIRGPLYTSLMDYIKSSKSTIGLESIFLTLFHLSTLPEVLYTLEMVKFLENTPKTVVPGNGPMLFYEVHENRLHRLSDDHAHTIMNGHFPGPLDPHRLPETFGPPAVWMSTDFVTFHAPAPAPAPVLAPASVHSHGFALTDPTAPAAPHPVVVPAHPPAAPINPLTVHVMEGHAPAQAEKSWFETGAKFVGAALAAAAVFWPQARVAVLCKQGATLIALSLATNEVLNKLDVKLIVDTNKTFPEAPEDDTIQDAGASLPGGTPDEEGGEEPATSGDGEGGDAGTSGEGGEGGEGCFVFNTPVLMSDGSLKAIGVIVQGDSVLARTEAGQEESCCVTCVHTTYAPETVELKLSNSTLVTTPKQRFSLNLNDGFAAAGILETGVVLNRMGRQTTFVDMKITGLPAQEVFNLTVEKAHTYFVGEECVLVHNRKINEEHHDDGHHGGQ